MAEISVILPTFNRAHTLKRCLDSVLAQTGADYQVLVVDDGSTDHTEEVLSGYMGNPSLKIIKQKNKGVSHARNIGTAQSDSKYIAFIDSDDEWLPGKLEAQLQFQNQNSFRIHQTTEQWIRNGVRVNPPKHLLKREGDLFTPSLERCMITPSSVFMERKLFEEHDGFNENYRVCEDYDLWLKITRVEKVGLIGKDYLKRYGGHEDQLSAAEAMDEWRIRSMFELHQKKICNPEQTDDLVNVLNKKLKVFYQGACKRGIQDKMDWCTKIADECAISL